jgi:hypothetical protein
MRPSGTVPFTFAACLLLSACGQYLGDYSLEKVEVVRELPRSFPKDAQGYGKYLAITLSSKTNVTALGDEVSAIYANADFCPMRDGDQLVVLGPVSETGESLRIPSIAANLKPGRDGRFRYSIYLVPAHPMPGIRYSETALQAPRYDLRSANHDVCVRLFAPGFNITPSRSGTVTIGAKLIETALALGADSKLSPKNKM